MGRWMRGALALLMLVCAAAPARAVDIPNNRSLQTSTAVQPVGLGYWNNTRWVSWNGATHDYFADETALQIVGGGVLDTCQVGKANTANPLTAASLTQYPITGKYVWVNIKVTGITAGYPWSVRFYGARDGATFAPLMRSITYWRGNTAGDTLKITARAATGANGIWVPLTSDGPLIANQLIAVCSNDSAIATVGTTATFVITVEQRK